MGESALTVRDKIVVHLSAYNRYADEFECPEDMCQSGISQAIGKSRAHITLELNRMKEAGLVYERNARIKGAKSKRKTYLLTSSGLTRNTEINSHLESLNIELRDEEGSKFLGGTEAAALLRSRFGMLRVAAVDQILDSGGMLDLSRLGRAAKPLPANPHMPPRIENFLARKEWDDIVGILEMDTPNTLMLLGIPGIGKTALLSQLAWARERKSPIFYRKLYPFDSPASVMKTLADFMEGKGHSGLSRFMANTQSIDFPEAGTHISRFLSNKRIFMIFDDYENAPATLIPLFGLFMELVRGTGSCMLVSSARKGDFYSLRNLALEEDVREIKLGPLGRESAMELLGQSGGEDADEKLRTAGGHPLTLRLLATGVAPGSLSGYVEDDILGKDSDLSRMCRFAAVLRKPFTPEDLELFGFGDAKGIRNNLAFEAQPDGGFLLHSAISSIMMAATGKRMQREMHSRAADFYISKDSDPHEALHHFIQANNMEKAREHVLANRDALLASDKIEELASMMELVLWGGCESVELMDIASEILDRAGKWDRAGKLAMEIGRCVPGTPLAAKSGILRANILAKTGNLDEALTVLESFKVAAEDTEFDAKFNHSMACILRRKGDNREALKICKKAAALAKKRGDATLHAQCQMESAMILTASGEHQKSLDLLEKARKDFRKMGSAPDIIRCDINRGMVLRACDRPDEAIESLENAAEAAEKAGLNRFRAHALVNLTDLLNRKSEFKRSASLAGEAIAIFSGLGEPLMQSAAMLNLCSALAGSGERDKAMSNMDEAIAILKKNRLLETRNSWLAECADILRGMGEKKRAAEVLRMNDSQ